MTTVDRLDPKEKDLPKEEVQRLLKLASKVAAKAEDDAGDPARGALLLAMAAGISAAVSSAVMGLNEEQVETQRKHLDDAIRKTWAGTAAKLDDEMVAKYRRALLGLDPETTAN